MILLETEDDKRTKKNEKNKRKQNINKVFRLSRKKTKLLEKQFEMVLCLPLVSVGFEPLSKVLVRDMLTNCFGCTAEIDKVVGKEQLDGNGNRYAMRKYITWRHRKKRVLENLLSIVDQKIALFDTEKQRAHEKLHNNDICRNNNSNTSYNNGNKRREENQNVQKMHILEACRIMKGTFAHFIIIF